LTEGLVASQEELVSMELVNLLISEFSLPLPPYMHRMYPFLCFWSHWFILSGSAFEIHFITMQHPLDMILYLHCLCSYSVKENYAWSRATVAKCCL